MDAKEMLPVVYICSPFSGDTEGNTERIRKYCRYAVRQKVIPVAMHLLLPQFMKESTERELAMSMDLQILGRCDEPWVFGGRVTEGMRKEIGRAEETGMRIRYVTEDEICTG